MKVVQKKICLLGDFGVGKTSLVKRFVNNEFSEKYLTTVGVKIDTKLIEVNKETAAKLIIWDIAGTNCLTTACHTYLRGAAGFILVIDGTRSTTLNCVLKLKQLILQSHPESPFVILLNKTDLADKWEITDQSLAELNTQKEHIFFTSAKTGANVEEAFQTLSQSLLL